MSSGQSEDEIAGGPSGPRVWRPGSWATLTMGVVVAFVVGLIVGMRVNGSTDVAPTPTPSGGPSPTASAPAPTGPATKWLIQSGGSYSTTSTDPMGIATFWTTLTNVGAQPLTPAGPVQLVGPDGKPVPHMTAGLAAYDGGQHSQLPLGSPPARIAAHGGKVVVGVLAPYYCRRDRYAAAWPDTYPRIVIPLQGYEQPATYSFSDLFSGGGKSFYSRLCPTAGDTEPTGS